MTRHHLRVLLAAALLVPLLAISGSPPSAADNATPAPVENVGETVDTGGRPNVLVLKADDAPYSAMSAMSYLQSEPGGRWVNFTNAYYNQPLCCPERCAWFTGMYAHENGVTANDLGKLCPENKSVALVLQQAGYRTIFDGKHYNGYCTTFRLGGSVPPGWDDWHALCASRNEYTNYEMSDNGQRHTYAEYIENHLADQAIASIDATPAGQPWFVYWGARAPHAPRTVCREHADDAFPELPVRNETINPTDAALADQPRYVRESPRLSSSELAYRDSQRLAAHRTLRCLDDQFRRVVEHLKTIGEFDNTMIVVQSDNGFNFGEKRLYGKNTAQNTVTRMPLFIRYPGAPAEGLTVSEMVTNVDLAPTLAHLAGSSIPWHHDGRSLRPLLEGSHPADWRTGVLIENRGTNNTRKQPQYWAVREEDAILVDYANAGQGGELYLGRPLDEMRNRYNDPAVAGIRARMEAHLACLIAETCS